MHLILDIRFYLHFVCGLSLPLLLLVNFLCYPAFFSLVNVILSFTFGLLFRHLVARPPMMTAKVKEAAGIVGLYVVHNVREVLIELYSKTLDETKGVVGRESLRSSESEKKSSHERRGVRAKGE